MTLEPRRSLRASILSVPSLTCADRDRMFSLMQLYYDDASRVQFDEDLDEKDAVIILRDDSPAACIQGFSTLLNLTVVRDGREHRGIFSGDTVVARAYWGQKTLGKAFLKYLFMQKVRKPFKPLYWLLISKGYKTYLLMANNFRTHYPCVERATPAVEKGLMDSFYAQLYPERYDRATGLIGVAAGDAYRLRDGVAPIAPALLDTNPRVAFFVEKNPEWSNGTELACLAKMSFFMPLYYAGKAFLKTRLAVYLTGLRPTVKAKVAA